MKVKIKMLIISTLILFAPFNLLYSQSQTIQTTINSNQQVLNLQKEKLKEILYKLVRQDEDIDKMVQEIQEKKNNLAAEEITALFSNIRRVKDNLEHISHLNKKEFENMSSNIEISKYTRAIMVYSNKINVKIRKMIIEVNSLLINKKKQIRNAPISKKSRNKGKNIKQILKERENLQVLKNELSALFKSSFKTKATSKWLYIASK